MRSGKVTTNPKRIIELLNLWSSELGFDGISVAQMDLTEDSEALSFWLSENMHGSMAYMGKNLDKRANPETLFDGTLSIISTRMHYRKEDIDKDEDLLMEDTKAFISRYALGRDYHKTIRSRLKILGKKLEHEVGKYGYRVFSDSAPILERAIARNAGLGWIGKNTMPVSYTHLTLPTKA